MMMNNIEEGMMDGEWRLGEWHIEIDQEAMVVCDAEDRPVATVHGDDPSEQLRRAILISRAPALKRAVELALESFGVIAANDLGRAGEAAAQLLPYFQAALHGLDDSGST